jgi:hypothetical protein
MGISLGRELRASVQDLLRQRKEILLNDWLHRILDEYAGEASILLEKRQDRFTNPMAYAFREAIEAVFRALADHTDADLGPIEYAVKIKAVQEKDPDKGVAFLHIIKDTVREKLGDSVEKDELAELDCRIDRIASAASEMFVMHRRKIAELGRTSASLIV